MNADTQTARKRAPWMGIALFALAAAALFFSARGLIAPSLRMPSGSMEPTIATGGAFDVFKGAYGYTRLSFAPLDGALPDGRFFARTPERGDIIFFRLAHEPGRDWVKRIIGMPGERIQMIAGVPHINGAPVRHEDTGEIRVAFGGAENQPARAVRETLPNGVSFITADNGESALDNTAEFVVPDGHYFVIGDSRDNSDDSRGSFGFVPFELVIGRVTPRA